MIAIAFNTPLAIKKSGAGILVLIDVCQTQSSSGPYQEAEKRRNNTTIVRFSRSPENSSTARFYSLRLLRNLLDFVEPLFIFCFSKMCKFKFRVSACVRQSVSSCIKRALAKLGVWLFQEYSATKHIEIAHKLRLITPQCTEAVCLWFNRLENI